MAHADREVIFIARNGGSPSPFVHIGGEKWPTQCQPRPFYSQAQILPCCLHPSGAPTHLPLPTLSAHAKSQKKMLRVVITEIESFTVQKCAIKG